ncbi:MAG: cytochrome c biogenesis protein CcdA [Bacillota bacterium]
MNPESVLNALSNFSPLSAGVFFAGGLMAGMSPCTLPSIFLVVGYAGGYSGGSRARAAVFSLAFVLGLSFTLAALGGLAALVGGIFRQNGFLLVLTGIMLLVMGACLTGGSYYGVRS